MPSAEIIAIGTEILLGEIQDTNTRYLARQLRDLGIDMYRTSVIGDNEERIAALIRESLQRCDIVITTGGLGPTVDDPTRQAVARAMGTTIVFSDELWSQVQDRFSRYGRAATPNNRRQAYIPEGAIPIENPVGTAPAFICETGTGCVASLPGVPREMEYLYENSIVPYLRERYKLTGLIKARVLHVSGLGESVVDDLLGELEKSSNPTVGLLAHPGQVDVRITAKAGSNEQADQMIAVMENQVRALLGSDVFGCDQETLESVLCGRLMITRQPLTIIFEGQTGDISPRMQSLLHSCPDDLIRINPADPANTQGSLMYTRLTSGEKRQRLELRYSTNGSVLASDERSYGGPPQNGPAWAWNSTLDYILRNLTA